MSKKAIKHTISIFESICDPIPPLVPDHIEEEIISTLECLRSSNDVDLCRIEDEMIACAKKMWPYMRAFQELREVYEVKIGHKLLLQRVPRELRGNVELFIESGGSFKDIYLGKAQEIIPQKHHKTIHELVVKLRNEIRNHVRQAALNHEKKKYEQRIKELQKLLEETEVNLEKLRMLADKDVASSNLSGSIHSFVRGVEYGFSGLGPGIDPEEVFQAYEDFLGRMDDIILHNRY